MTRYKGQEAIEIAEARGLTLSKHADPIEDAREGLSIDEAREIAAEDPGLIYVDVEARDQAGAAAMREQTVRVTVRQVETEEPCDAVRSTRAYAEQLLAALRHAFPHAEVDVEAEPNTIGADRYAVENADEDEVRRVAERVFTSGDWMVAVGE